MSKQTKSPQPEQAEQSPPEQLFAEKAETPGLLLAVICTKLDRLIEIMEENQRRTWPEHHKTTTVTQQVVTFPDATQSE